MNVLYSIKVQNNDVKNYWISYFSITYIYISYDFWMINLVWIITVCSLSTFECCLNSNYTKHCFTSHSATFYVFIVQRVWSADVLCVAQCPSSTEAIFCVQPIWETRTGAIWKHISGT